MTPCTCIFHPVALNFKQVGNVETDAFLGSFNALSIFSQKSIHLLAGGDSSACLAATTITLIAKDAISIGTGGVSSIDLVKIYSPFCLSITAKHVSICHVDFVEKAVTGSISCDKLTLSKVINEEPPYYEIVKSMILLDKTEVEYLA